MASAVPVQQPAQQRSAKSESREEFDTRMLNMVSRLETTDTIFFYKLVSKSMATELVQGPFAYSLEFPRDFLLQHSKKFGIDVTFVTPDSNRTWPIKITIRSLRDTTQLRTRVFAYGPGGWQAFLMDNHIKVGDVLLFKLTRFSHFEVFIGRSPTEVHLDADQDNVVEDNADQTTLRATSSNKLPLYPKFEVAICRPSQPQHPENQFYLEEDLSLVVPLDFWELHSKMLEGNELRLKGPIKTITKVKVERISNEEVQMARLEHYGWKAFLLANNLGIGDVLEFSLVANSSCIVEAAH